MNRNGRLLKRRDLLASKLASHAGAVSGNLSKAAIPTGSANFYWRITWKEKQKTKLRYVRAEHFDAIKTGIEHFAQLKQMIQEIGDINREIILSQPKRSS
jgi:hypothetical protein